MRIALVSEHADPLAALGGADAGGQNVHVAALATGLARMGHEVTVYTRRDSTSSPTRVVVDDGYVVDHVAAGPPHEVPKDELLPHMPELAARLRERWRQQPVDLVHAHFWMSGLASVWATQDLDVPVLQTFHALGSVKRRHQGDQDTSPPTRIGHEEDLCRQVTHVVATCSDEVAELEAMGMPEGRASVIPCGVDVASFRPGPIRAIDDSGRYRLLVLGRMVPRKGVDTVLQALVDLPETELVVAGGPAPEAMDADPEITRLKKCAGELGITDRVSFLGSVDRTAVPGLIRSSDVVVTVPWYEPFGIVPLEAMACGRPVVASAVGGLQDTVVPGETGELVPPRAPKVLAAELQALLDDPARRAAYGEAGRRRAVERYDWQCVVERTEQVYRDIAGATYPARQEVAK